VWHNHDENLLAKLVSGSNLGSNQLERPLKTRCTVWALNHIIRSTVKMGTNNTQFQCCICFTRRKGASTMLLNVHVRWCMHATQNSRTTCQDQSTLMPTPSRSKWTTAPHGAHPTVLMTLLDQCNPFKNNMSKEQSDQQLLTLQLVQCDGTLRMTWAGNMQHACQTNCTCQ